jgi:hypothetical protein
VVETVLKFYVLGKELSYKNKKNMLSRSKNMHATFSYPRMSGTYSGGESECSCVAFARARRRDK